MTPRLLTIPFSHYCEKARWAADHHGVAYREEKYLPGVHIAPVRKAGGRTVPVLVTDHGAFFDSTDILKHLDSIGAECKRLYPAETEARREVLELEDLFDTRLGPATRIYAYHHGLPNPGSLRRILAPSMSPLQRLAFRALLPLIGPRIRRKYRINDATAESAEMAIRETFAMVSARLESGRYIVGDRFSAADLTFASLAAPSLMPPGHPAFPSKLDREPPGLLAFVRSLRQTKAGAHALRMYREHRQLPPR